MRQFFKESKGIVMSRNNEEKTSMSAMMVKLYGEAEAQNVYNRLQEVDPWFNNYVQRVIYDNLWALPPLNFLQKSLATIVALSTLKKEEQLQIHIKGFYHLGGNQNDLKNIFQLMLEKKYITSTENLLSILKNVPFKPESSEKKQFILDSKNIAIIELASLAALGDNDKTKEYMKSEVLSDEEMRGVLRHIMTYSGCPCAMNGFAVLKDIADEKLGFKCKL